MVRYRLHGLIALTVLALPTCGAQNGATRTPLATWDPGSADGVHDATVGSGTLSIVEDCTRLVLDNGKTVLLVWPEPTAWDADAQTILFVDVFGERLELKDGDRVVPGGSSAARAPRFSTAPAPSCVADEIFIVATMRVVTEE